MKIPVVKLSTSVVKEVVVDLMQEDRKVFFHSKIDSRRYRMWLKETHMCLGEGKNGWLLEF